MANIAGNGGAEVPNSWQLFEGNVVVPANCTQARVYLERCPAGDAGTTFPSLFIDDLEVTLVSIP